MKKSGRFLTFLVAVIALCAVFCVSGIADVGNFSSDSDFGGGSSSDWGGSSSDWDSSSDWSSSDSSSGDDSDLSFGDMLLGVLLFGGIFVVVILFNKNKSKKSGGQPQGGARAAAPQNQIPLIKLKEKDPDFSESDFIETVGNYYIQMQDAWEAKKFEPMRAVFTDALYNQLSRQLQEYIDKKQTNHVDRISVLSANITSYSQDDKNDILTIELRTRVVDYVTDDATGKVLRGSDSLERYMTYEWTLVRGKEYKTVPKGTMHEVNCPNCGAPMNINQTQKCEYCGSIVTISDHDWAISAIRGIRQETK